ncbi:MAG: 6-carboxytetrahydropterin synthase [Eggerthellaceae bacterium]|nr:6-carboxytetrahydropterin synthase [Eggerthellaceae bacterium]
MHGHRRRVVIEVSADELNTQGMKIDFNYLNKIMKKICNKVDLNPIIIILL